MRERERESDCVCVCVCEREGGGEWNERNTEGFACECMYSIE